MGPDRLDRQPRFRRRDAVGAVENAAQFENSGRGSAVAFAFGLNDASRSERAAKGAEAGRQFSVGTGPNSERLLARNVNAHHDRFNGRYHDVLCNAPAQAIGGDERKPA